jgi:hypothetical protein
VGVVHEYDEYGEYGAIGKSLVRRDDRDGAVETGET